MSLRSEKLTHLVYRLETMGNCILHLFSQLSVSFIVALRLKHWIPAEVSTASWLDDSPFSLAHEKPRLLLLCSLVGDDAHSVDSFIWERLYHFCKALRSYVFKEPFDVWSRQSLIGIKAKGGVFYKDRSFGLLVCDVGFFPGDFKRVSLQFRY